ncbi:MAG: thioredoxin domain-containing protein [bacterium]|nr:thioredoxin domain-containing protein [bacterium]
MSHRPTRHRVALAIALLGVAVSLATWWVGHGLATDASYTSFCNVGGAVNCDVVLGSRWSTFLGVPVSLWSVVLFTVGALAAFPGAFAGVASGFADLLLIGLASWSLGFALVLAAVAFAVLRNACLFCLTLDVIVVAWCIAVLPLVRDFAPSARVPLPRRRPAAYGVAGGALLLAVATGTIAAIRAPEEGPTTLAAIRSREPDFFRFYTGLPVVPPADVLGAATNAKGPTDAPVTIVEFSDFQCPACGAAFRDLHALTKANPNVRLVFRHYPLDSSCNPQMERALHPDACQAAAAAECAGQLGKFWEYHDLLFENQRTLDRDSLFRYARELGLDITAFRTCLDDPATMARVRADVATGEKLGVDSTPTIFVNGRRISGALDPRYFAMALVIEQDTKGRGAGAPPGDG